MNYAVIGLGFGDEGKGKVVDYLCREKDCGLVVRFNGGAQAGHNVLSEGKHHCFAQFGAGSFVPGVHTLLSRFFLFDPLALAHENAVLSQTVGEYMLDRHFVDGRCVCVTPYHVLANQRTASKDRTIGTVGKGIGETVRDSLEHPEDTIYAGMLSQPELTLPRLRRTAIRKNLTEPDPEGLAAAYCELVAAYQVVTGEEANAMMRRASVVFEGAQGVLLDEDWGFGPWNTWSRTNHINVGRLVDDAGLQAPEIIGVIRCYHTRHGGGPFPSEEESMRNFNPGDHNGDHRWQGTFRSGGFDLSLFRYALTHCEVDSLCVNHLDLLHQGVPVYLTPNFDEACHPAPRRSAFIYGERERQGHWRTVEDLQHGLQRFGKPIRYLGAGPSTLVSCRRRALADIAA